jgi:predicted PurR-regulated permease PerM
VTTTRFVGNFLLGLVVMLVSLYFFLLDGRRMIEGVIRLSPLDRGHAEHLVEQFGELSRSVVLANVAAALTQGLLAGGGFYLAGVRPVFLLIVLTMLLSMIPFVGAISVWLPCCLWLMFVEHHYLPAILLAAWGLGVVSTVDNVIKPLILHGRANLHPLLALLSVLGGVKALGPIGIFVGPMVVAFLQTLLRMVQTELAEFSKGEKRE